MTLLVVHLYFVGKGGPKHYAHFSVFWKVSSPKLSFRLLNSFRNHVTPNRQPPFLPILGPVSEIGYQITSDA